MTDQAAEPLSATLERLAYTDPPNTHHYERPIPFTEWAVLTAIDFEGVQHWFHVPAKAVRNWEAATQASAVPALDVELLAEATATVVGWTGARDFHRDWAQKVAAEYNRLAAARLPVAGELA